MIDILMLTTLDFLAAPAFPVQAPVLDRLSQVLC
jgi:hypothetical protein